MYLSKTWPRVLEDQLAHIDFRLFGILVMTGLLPTIYLTVRINFLGALPADWGYNIASQLTWLNVMYEVLHEALLLPMMYLIGRHILDSERFSTAVASGLALIVVLFSVMSALTIMATPALVEFMAQETELIPTTIRYIRLESVALGLGAITRFLILVLLAQKDRVGMILMLALQLLLSVVFDSWLLSSLPFSLQLGVVGIAFSNLAVNAILISVGITRLELRGLRLWQFNRLDIRWLRDWARVGGLSGAESFVRNAAFVLMIVRLINVVGEQGTFWITNNFIWGWLLVPVLALGELVRRDAAQDVGRAVQNGRAYGLVTFAIILLWIVTIPLWRGFIEDVMGVNDSAAVFRLALISLGFYFVFALNNIADSVFYGSGRTDLMLYQSLIVNIIYYGGLFVLFHLGMFVPSLTGIAVMFGAGIAIDSAITFVMYRRFSRSVPVPA
jgi:hypothetical protein